MGALELRAHHILKFCNYLQMSISERFQINANLLALIIIINANKFAFTNYTKAIQYPAVLLCTL